MGAEHGAEARSAFAELIAALEHGGRGNGGGSNNGGGSGNGGGGGGEDFGPINGRMLIAALRQMAEMQKTCTLMAAEQQADFTTKTAETLAAAIRAGRDAMEATTKQLHENAMRTAAANTRLAEAVANRFEALEARVVILERELARSRPAGDTGADVGSGP